MRVPINTRIDDPSSLLLQGLISYWGITTANGAATGLTLVCAALANEPSYVGLQVKMLSGPAAGQVRTILISAAGTLTVDDAFRDNTGAATTILAGSLFVILSQSAGGGGPIPPTCPTQGLSFMGDVTNAISAVSFASTDLAGFGNDAFVNTYMIFVFRDAGGGVAPQGEFRLCTAYVAATGTFTHEAFSANLAVGDKVILIHLSIIFPRLMAMGNITGDSVVQPVDNTRAEANQFFRGCTLMMLTGPVRYQTRAIVYYTNPGIFTLDTQNPFTALPGVGSRYLVQGSDFPTAPGADATPSLTPGDVLGNKNDTAVYAPDLISSAMRYLKGLIAINPVTLFDLVNAIFTLKETGGIINTAGAGLYDVYRNETPMGVFKPKRVLIDTTLNGAGETIVVSVSYRIISGGAYVLKDTVSFAGVQALPLKNIELEPNRFGVLVTLQRTAGVARDYPYEVFYED